MTVRNAASMGMYGVAWESQGYGGSGNVRELLGSLRGRPALVCGGAEGVFDEMNDALGKLTDPVIFAANDIGMFLPHVDHWVTLHSDNLGAWKQVRWLHPREREVTKYHAPDKRAYVDYVWDGLRPLFCLSGYFAMQCAYLMGCEPIVLCGCPGEARRRFFDLTTRADFGYGDPGRSSSDGVRQQLIEEMKRLPEFRARVRSMSGWTQSFLGGL